MRRFSRNEVRSRYIHGFFGIDANTDVDLFAIRNWRAESFTSLLSHPQFAATRDDRCKRMTVELGKPFLIFLPHGTDVQEYYRSLDEKVISSAVELQEKLQSSIHHYWFSLSNYAGAGTARHDARASELLAESDQVDCEDIFRNRRRFDPDKLYETTSREEILHNLYPICTLSPRLMMRQVGSGEIIKEPRVVRKQKTLVAWGSPETITSKLQKEPQTLMNAIYVKPLPAEPSHFFKRWS